MVSSDQEPAGTSCEPYPSIEVTGCSINFFLIENSSGTPIASPIASPIIESTIFDIIITFIYIIYHIFSKCNVYFA